MRTVRYISIAALIISAILFLWSEFFSSSDGEDISYARSFSITTEQCTEKGIPITGFTIEYPFSVEVIEPNNDRDFITFQVRAADLVIEELWIRSEVFTNDMEDRIIEWLDSYVERYNMNFDEIAPEFVGKKDFGGKEHYQIQTYMNLSATGELKGQPITYSGNYRMLSILPIPKTPGLNAVAITLLAHPDSEIKDFDDFPTKGIVGKIFRTFRYQNE